MDDLDELASDIGEIALARGLTVAAAESVTAGNIAIALAAAPDASEWFSASVVAYRTAMKRDILGVTSDTIISERCAREMAAGVLRLTGADLAVAVTGVGGPDDEEGRPPGTVYICAGGVDAVQVFEHAFDGDPEEVVRQAGVQALRHLHDAARAMGGGAS